MNLDIPAKYQNIAVLFSGGADSTAILYEVASKYPDRKICHVVRAGDRPRALWSEILCCRYSVLAPDPARAHSSP